jgi:hypothetical protein
MLLAQSEPPPAGWTAGVEYAVKHAEGPQSAAFFTLLAVAIPCIILLLAGLIVVKVWLPKQEKQRELDRLSNEKQRELDRLASEKQGELFRDHAEKLLLARGKDATEDAAALRELARVQHTSIVERIGDAVQRATGEIAKLSDRSERHGELLSKIAAKAGIGLLILLVLVGAARGAYEMAITAPACRCDPPCSAGQRCTCNGCQEIKTITTTSGPHSALVMNTYANIAGFNCSTSSTACN